MCLHGSLSSLAKKSCLFVLLCSVSLGSVADTDSDGVPNDEDNCPNVPNSDQLDTDEDGSGNKCDQDDDSDGFRDSIEVASDTDPLNADETPISGGSLILNQGLIYSYPTGFIGDPDFDLNQQEARLTVSRLYGSRGEVSVRYRTLDGATSKAGRDYESVDGVLTWADGDTSQKKSLLKYTPRVQYWAVTNLSEWSYITLLPALASYSPDR